MVIDMTEPDSLTVSRSETFRSVLQTVNFGLKSENIPDYNGFRGLSFWGKTRTFTVLHERIRLMRSKVLVTDLDDTLLHNEPEEIPVLGRSGYRYMSEKSAELLTEISRIIPVLIATGRNAQSVRRLVRQLDSVRFCGFVLENGLVSRTHLDNGNTAGKDEWVAVTRMLPDWERLTGYERCLGMIFPSSVEEPKGVLADVLSRAGKSEYLFYQERHKIFAYPFFPSKLSGVHSLGFEPLIVLGDELNDLDMLQAAPYPATMSSAREEAKECVREKNGYCSSFASHAASEDILTWAIEMIHKTL